MSSEGDVVLIYYQNNPTLFARIEAIEADYKKGWYHVTLLFLTIPPQTATWILREEYIDGAEFTMGGRTVRLEELKRVDPPRAPDSLNTQDRLKDPKGGGRVIPFKKS